MFARLLLAVVVAAGCAVPASASPITYNLSTGQGGGANGTADPLYKITSPSATSALITNPNPNWTANFGSSPSRWISDVANAATGTSAGNTTFTFQTTFDLTGTIPGTASLSGLVAADNMVTVLLNGNTIAGPFGTNDGLEGFSSGSAPFAFATTNPAFFVSGTNTLTFQVFNGTGPVGLRVDALATAAVPEPTTLAVFGFGLAGIGAYVRRRKAAASA